MGKRIHPVIPYLLFTTVLTIVSAALIWLCGIIHITKGQLLAGWGVIMFIGYAHKYGFKEAFFTSTMIALFFGSLWFVGRLFFR